MHEETYAARFKEEVFKTIPMGTSQAEVVQQLGEPLEKWNHWNSDLEESQCISYG